MKSYLKIGMVCVGLLAVSACTTVKSKIADFDFIKLPEFREEAENIGDYPAVINAPKAPTDIRSDAAWDDSVRTLIAKGNGFTVPTDVEIPLSEEEIQRKINELNQKVEAYKLDDPQ